MAVSTILSPSSCFQCNAYSSTLVLGTSAYDPPFVMACVIQPVTIEHAAMPIAAIISFFILLFLFFLPLHLDRECAAEGIKRKRRTPKIISSGGAAKSPTKNMNRKYAAWIPRNAPSYLAFRLGELAAFQKAQYAVAYVAAVRLPTRSDGQLWKHIPCDPRPAWMPDQYMTSTS